MDSSGGQPWRVFPNVRRKRDKIAHEALVETPSQLAERLRNELRELVDLGEISPDFARRVMDDLLEPAAAGRRISLRPNVWRRYVEDFAGQAR